MVQLKNVAIIAAVGAASYASASPVEPMQERTLGLLYKLFELKKSAWSKCAPWKHASLPSFTWGCHAPGIPTWGGGDKSKCWLIWNKHTPFCQNGNVPPKPDGDCSGAVCKSGYEQVFKNYTTVAHGGVYDGKTVGAATIDNANYITYLLVDNVDKCLQACNEEKGCFFVNIYQDNADKPEDIDDLPDSVKPKFTKGNLTCALYKACSGKDKATNYGGQQDPTYITDSDGYCKNGKCKK
ncbi:hypothetical protein EX895_001082 [Sporisorium graminicola]|uniref:Uncharacterized protein n=1 Tax=Sporisorium graminicola TaxID=280036 RepID=A0A4U7KY48_9BASI|nr:hypothetical protein EX895_001082 [Sporisorium graminicola]TKY89785.1 hypothetical protein EX895_001082 [Sporisorium graminicola]